MVAKIFFLLGVGLPLVSMLSSLMLANITSADVVLVSAGIVSLAASGVAYLLDW